MSVALTGPPMAVYREEQSFAWWVYALLLGLLLLGFGALQTQRDSLKEAVPGLKNLRQLEVPLYLLMGVVTPSVLVTGVLHMTTELLPGRLNLWFGWVPTLRRSIPLAEIEHVEIVRYNAWQDHGFWGYRQMADGEVIFTARGDRAVRVVLSDGSRILIGTQRPDDLASALNRERPSKA